MELTHLFAFNVTLLAAILSPGPAMLVAIKSTLTGGFHQGFAVGLGLAMMAAIWTMLALVGLNGIFVLFPWAYMILKVAGALYLIWIAVHTWRNANVPISANATSTKNGKSFLTGLSVNLANPKSVLFASAVLLVIFPQDMTLLSKAIVVLNHFAVEVVSYTLFALLLSTPVARDRYMRAKAWMDRVAAGVMSALGIRLLLER